MFLTAGYVNVLSGAVQSFVMVSCISLLKLNILMWQSTACRYVCM